MKNSLQQEVTGLPLFHSIIKGHMPEHKRSLDVWSEWFHVVIEQIRWYTDDRIVYPRVILFNSITPHQCISLLSIKQ